jgi:hypothetical protein
VRGVDMSELTVLLIGRPLGVDLVFESLFPPDDVPAAAERDAGRETREGASEEGLRCIGYRSK